MFIPVRTQNQDIHRHSRQKFHKKNFIYILTCAQMDKTTCVVFLPVLKNLVLISPDPTQKIHTLIHQSVKIDLRLSCFQLHHFCKSPAEYCLQNRAHRILYIHLQIRDHLLHSCIVVSADFHDLICCRVWNAAIHDHCLPLLILQFQIKLVQIICISKFILHTTYPQITVIKKILPVAALLRCFEDICQSTSFDPGICAVDKPIL